MGADGLGAREDGLDNFRGGVGGDIEVLRLNAEEKIAHTAAGEEGLMSGACKSTHHLERGAVGGAFDVLDGRGCPMGVGGHAAPRTLLRCPTNAQVPASFSRR